ncbi:MAG: ribonuclease P protein component [Patescibacteria group bacterium]
MAALKRSYRLSGRKTINGILRSGRRMGAGGLTVYVLQSKNLNTRVAVIVPKKVDKRAVKRNKLRRQISEIMRKIIPQIIEPLDIIIYAGPQSAGSGFDGLEKTLNAVFKKLIQA